ncbi:uncharacterized protein LOC115887778 [Sitophilus oryzae]|uniref:Uncharacterized protein LOC115887778 n=1 Tax=Sitophilus oryzae TaxID=7048 RepID=A0A6J2YIN7_SITOR|nr:uncharacterized protein LOC115887778 [Sitophilus oryzae]
MSNHNLPKLKLPDFYGSYEKWLQFADTYRSLIHNSNSLSKIEKFWYLKSCLKGDAANLLTSLEVSEANYDKAWSLLSDRYENKRAIIQTHLKSFFEMPVITKESHIALRNLIDTSSQHLRSLESLGLPIEHWDTILIYQITSKLDLITRKGWEDYSLKLPTDTPAFDELISFLNDKCQVLESISTNIPSQKSTSNKCSNKNSSSTFVSTIPHVFYATRIILFLHVQNF